VPDNIIVTRFLNNPIPSNCFVVHVENTTACLLVDPADHDPVQLISYLELKKLRPDYIILTHEHFDHISGVNFFKSRYDCKVIATDTCSLSIQYPKKNLSVFHDNIGFSCAPADISIKDKHFQIPWGTKNLKFYKTPGHSEGSLCFGIDNKLFTGDTIIKGHKTVLKIVGGNKQHLIASLNEIFNTFDEDTMIFPGHGENFLLKEVNIESLT
jgi:hydroxyacylglutathione hydrolase